LSPARLIEQSPVTNRPGRRLTWWLLAAGQLLFVVGDLLFDLHERVWETDAFPSAADGFYLNAAQMARLAAADRPST
jgi:hypothetical protein